MQREDLLGEEHQDTRALQYNGPRWERARRAVAHVAWVCTAAFEVVGIRRYDTA